METNSINSFLVLITGDIDNFMYTYILVALLVFTGIYFTIRTKGVQFRYIKDMFTQLFEKKVDKNGKAISSFQAMMVSTGSRVGTGNIAGIATALAMGGPGALFWMWVMALIGGASAFIESTLAQIFKIRGKDGQFRGGPAYYIQQGLGKRWMGIVFAVSLIACYVVGFNELQAYNAASGLEYYIPDYATNGAAVVLGVVFTIATAAVIFGGQKRISVINCAEAVQFVPPNAMQQAIRSEQPITRMGVRCRWLCLSFALLERAADISSSFQRHQA